MELKDIVAGIGILILGGSLIYLALTIRSSVEEERKRMSKAE